MQENPVLHMYAFVRDVTPENSEVPQYECANNVFLLKLVFEEDVVEYICLAGEDKNKKIKELKNQGYFIEDSNSFSRLTNFLKKEQDD